MYCISVFVLMNKTIQSPCLHGACYSCPDLPFTTWVWPPPNDFSTWEMSVKFSHFGVEIPNRQIWPRSFFLFFFFPCDGFVWSKDSSCFISTLSTQLTISFYSGFQVLLQISFQYTASTFLCLYPLVLCPESNSRSYSLGFSSCRRLPV